MTSYSTTPAWTSGAIAPPHSVLRPGAILADRYVIERELGRGGMGTVYLARDLKHRRPVAVKVLLPELTALLGHERFLHEIEIAAGLQHPYIVGVHDSGEEGGLLYFTMPYVAGESLRGRIAREGELPVATAVRILCDVLDALSYAHRQGVVHRDVKPDNVLLTGRHALVMDFGVARAVTQAVTTSGPEGRERLTLEGVAVGTPEYMAPEQAAADPRVDHRADLYAVGVLAYELLTGGPPFTGASPQQVLAAQVTRAPTPLTELRPTLAPALVQAVTRCLEKRPADRWQSAEELLDQLEALGTPGPTAVRVSDAPRELAEESFRLSAAVCRTLDRAALDPRMIGDHLRYYDNRVESRVLVCYLHGIGLDQCDFEETLRVSPYRGVAPALYGFEPTARHRVPLPLEQHARVIRAFLRDVIARARPRRVVLAGFSAGADLAFSVVRTPAGEAPLPVDGLLALGCNLSLETCFASRVLAELSDGDPARLVADLAMLGGHARSLGEWLNLHEYLVRVIRKFQGDVAAVSRFARDVIAPFEANGWEAFAERYRTAAAEVPVVRCVAADQPIYDEAVERLRLAHLDSGALGPRFDDDALVIERGADHFALLDARRVVRHVDGLLAAIGTNVS